MKKVLKIAVAMLMLAVMSISSGCSSVVEKTEYPTYDDGTVYIADSVYRTYYLAFTWGDENYVGKKYAIDGMFKMNTGEEGTTPYLFRYSTETHEEHKHTYELGFELEGDNLPKDLEEGAWIRVIGVVKAEVHGEHTHVAIEVDSWEKLEKAGNASV